MLEGNLADFIEDFTDDEFRFLIVFVKTEMNMPTIHAGSVFFVSRGALCNKIEHVRNKRNRPMGHQWSKHYAEVKELLLDGYKILHSIQRKVERRSFKVDRKSKKRKFTLTLYKEGKFFASYRCKTVQIAKDRGMVWATGRKCYDGQARDSAWSEPSRAVA